MGKWLVTKGEGDSDQRGRGQLPKGKGAVTKGEGGSDQREGGSDQREGGSDQTFFPVERNRPRQKIPTFPVHSNANSTRESMITPSHIATKR